MATRKMRRTVIRVILFLCVVVSVQGNKKDQKSLSNAPSIHPVVKERNSAFTNKINSFSTIHDLSKDDENKTTTATTQPPQPSSPISKNGNIPTISPSIPSYNGKLEDISQHLFTRKRPTMQPTFKRNREYNTSKIGNMREYNASKIVENTTETSLPASYDHQEYMISESNCLSNDAGSIGIMKGYTMMLNFSYEVDVAVIPHAGLFFATEKLPFVERSIVDYLGKQLFYDNCKDSRLDAIVGISSFPKDIFSLDMKCNEKQHLHGQQQENGSTKDNETASICYVIDGTMTLISVNSTAMDDDVRRIRGMILGIVDRTFGNVEIGLNRISVLVVDDESIPTTPTSGNIASPSDSSETSSMGRVSNKSDSPARMRIIIAISVMAACSLVLMAALLKTQLTQRREKHAWDEIRKILTESNSSTDGSRS